MCDSGGRTSREFLLLFYLFNLYSGAVRVSVSAQYVMCLCEADRTLSLILDSLCGGRAWTVLPVQCGLLVVERLVTAIQNEEDNTQTLMTVHFFFLSVSVCGYISQSLLRRFTYWSLKGTVAKTACLIPLSPFLDPLICMYLLIRGTVQYQQGQNIYH